MSKQNNNADTISVKASELEAVESIVDTSIATELADNVTETTKPEYYTDEQYGDIIASQGVEKTEKGKRELRQAIAGIETLDDIIDAANVGGQLNIVKLAESLVEHLPTNWESMTDPESRKTPREQLGTFVLAECREAAKRTANQQLDMQNVPDGERTRIVQTVFRKQAMRDLRLPSKVANETQSEHARNIERLARRFAEKRGLKIF